MIPKIKKNAKDPKVLAIVALLAFLGVENADSVSNVVANIAQSTQTPAVVDPPKINLDGPDVIDEGKLATFVAKESYGDHFSWMVRPELERQESEDSRSCVFGSVPGTYEITLFVSNCEGQAFETRTLTVLSTDNCPDDPVVPGPADPDPGLTGLAKEIHDLAISKVESKYRGDSGKLAKVFRDMSNDAAITDPQAFTNQTVVEVKNALGSNVVAWKSWYDAMNVSLQSRISQGKLVTITQYKDAWKQVAAGLEAL